MRPRKSWKNLDPEKPMTDSQKEYALNLMVESGDYSWEEALEELSSYGQLSQVGGHQLIKENFINLKLINDL